VIAEFSESVRMTGQCHIGRGLGDRNHGSAVNQAGMGGQPGVGGNDESVV
jgi:hypothetical protein